MESTSKLLEDSDEVIDGLDYGTLLIYSARNELGLLLSISSGALLLYDYLLTLNAEITLIWKPRPRLSVAKALWFLNRYYPPLTVLVRLVIEIGDRIPSRAFDLSRCSTSLARQFINWSTIVNFFVIEVMLILAVWALWNRSKPVGLFLSGYLLAALGMAVGLKGVYPGNLPTAATPPESMFPCSSRNSWPPYALFWFYTFGFSAQLLSFTFFIIKASQYLRGAFGLGSTVFIKALWHHGAMYYVIVICLQCISIASTISTTLFLPLDMAQIMIPIMSVTCNRMGLALREMFFNGNHGSLIERYETMGTVKWSTKRGSDQPRRVGDSDIVLDTMDLDELGIKDDDPY